ncbi:MAG: hypothetical protein K0U98_23245 [Deltaproteobacteria bacterium]|nr:hypothetical protein [Deltaproteobacteria bacterium]
MRLRAPTLFALPARFHYWGSLFLVLFSAAVISGQVANRHSFASGELYEEVADRWGAPIEQPAPSVRFVESGTVFNGLESLPLAGQKVYVEAAMSYRKRGLTYFSGFEFAFRGQYRVVNDQGKSLDLVFVFPIQMSKNKVLLSDLEFLVGGEPHSVDLSQSQNRLVWTGRLAAAEELEVEIAFRGRGLNSFTYRLDPTLPVKDFRFEAQVTGGDNFDYAPGVLPATSQTHKDGEVSLEWQYAALESGVPVGLILPSVKAYDTLIFIMAKRSWATFSLFFAGIVLLTLHHGRRLEIYESYLLAANYAFFFVLLAYLAAFMSFAGAFLLAQVITCSSLWFFSKRLTSPDAGRIIAVLLVALLVLPTLAVILRGYTGLIYTLEILAGLVSVTYLATRPLFRQLVERAFSHPQLPLQEDPALAK